MAEGLEAGVGRTFEVVGFVVIRITGSNAQKCPHPVGRYCGKVINCGKARIESFCVCVSNEVYHIWEEYSCFPNMLCGRLMLRAFRETSSVMGTFLAYYIFISDKNFSLILPCLRNIEDQVSYFKVLRLEEMPPAFFGICMGRLL